jgi:hypothetical protein
MHCAHCNKNIDGEHALQIAGNWFCNNLCRYSYEKATGKKLNSIIKDTVAKVAETETKRKNKLFPKITDAKSALKTIKDVAIAYYVIGGIFIAMGIFVGQNLLVDGGICIFLGLLLQYFKSRTAAIIMCIYSVISLGMTISNKIHSVQNLANGGTNIMMAVIIIIASLKAVEATFKYHKKYNNQRA